MRLAEAKDPFELYPSWTEEDEQVRIANGARAQRAVINDFKSRIPKSRVKFVAPPGSKKTDIIMVTPDGQEVHIEAKIAGTRITAYDASIRRGDSNELLDWAAMSLPFNKKRLGFSQLIDAIRRQDKRVGFPGDPGVAKSGKVPAYQFTEPAVLDELGKQLKARYMSRGDNYLALVDPATDRVRYHYISGPVIRGLQARRFPKLVRAGFDTYGWDPKSGNALRAAIKVFI
jgi:hypothetical protein